MFATGADNDIIHSGGGIDVVDGGDGNDRWGANMSFATHDIVIDLNGSSTFLGTGSVVNVEGFGGLTTGSGNDTLTSTGRRGRDRQQRRRQRHHHAAGRGHARRSRAARGTTGWS